MPEVKTREAKFKVGDHVKLVNVTRKHYNWGWWQYLKSEGKVKSVDCDNDGRVSYGVVFKVYGETYPDKDFYPVEESEIQSCEGPLW